MWSLAIVALTAGAVYWNYRHSRKPWLEYATYWCTRIYSQLWHRISYHGRMPWPRTGPMLLVSNHTCSADPPFLLGTSPRFLGFVSATEYFRINRLFHWYLRRLQCVPVRRGGRDPVAARQALRVLQGGGAVVLFPESNLAGVALHRQRPGKHGAAFLALASAAPVYPVCITGGPQTHKLLYAWLWASKKAVRVYFGPALDLSAYYGRPRTRAVLEEVTLLIMRRIQALKPSPATGGICDESGNHGRTDAQTLRAL